MELRYCSEALTNAIEVIIAVRPLSVTMYFLTAFSLLATSPLRRW